MIRLFNRKRARKVEDLDDVVTRAEDIVASALVEILCQSAAQVSELIEHGYQFTAAEREQIQAAWNLLEQLEQDGVIEVTR